MSYKIAMQWIEYEEMQSSRLQVMDEVFKKASPETFNEMKEECERLLDYYIDMYGNKEWVFTHFVPYTKLILYKDGKRIDFWSIEKYKKERGYL